MPLPQWDLPPLVIPQTCGQDTAPPSQLQSPDARLPQGPPPRPVQSAGASRLGAQDAPAGVSASNPAQRGLKQRELQETNA